MINCYICTNIAELINFLFPDGKINRAGNYRYFILTEKKNKPKPKKAAPKSESVDIKLELKKYN